MIKSTISIQNKPKDDKIDYNQESLDALHVTMQLTKWRFVFKCKPSSARESHGGCVWKIHVINSKDYVNNTK